MAFFFVLLPLTTRIFCVTAARRAVRFFALYFRRRAASGVEGRLETGSLLWNDAWSRV